jgi:hypothetical protein
MLVPMNETKQQESSHGNIGRQSSLSCHDNWVHCVGTEPVPSGDAAATARRRGLKRCQQTHDKCVSASSSGQGPRAPRANSCGAGA